MTTAALVQTAAPSQLVSLTPRSKLEDALCYGTFSLLLFGPLAFGAVEPWSQFVLQLGTAILLVLWAFQQARRGTLLLASNALFAPMLAFAVFIGLQLLIGHTVYRYATCMQAMLYATYGLVCFLVVQCLRRTRQVKILTISFTAYGFALAAFALAQSLSFNGKIYWLRTIHAGWAYGPYVNRNHYAGLMEMLVPVPLVFSLTKHARGPKRRLAAVAAALMSATVFLSASRGGMLALSVEMTVLFGILIKRSASRHMAWVLGSILVLVFALLAWLGGGELSQRIASIDHEAHKELSGGVRLSIARDSLNMFRQRPLLGWGLGTFGEIYPQYRSFYTSELIDQAHDDYVQLLVEGGGIGFCIAVWFLVVLYRRAAPKLREWERDTNGAIALAAMLGCTGILVHSFLDFNLQVPANAVMFYSLACIAAMEPRFRIFHNRFAELEDLPEPRRQFVAGE